FRVAARSRDGSLQTARAELHGMKPRITVLAAALLTALPVLPAAAARDAAPNKILSVSLVGPGAQSRWAYVLEQTSVHAAPQSSAPTIATLSTATALGQPNLVLLLREQADADGKDWVLVRLAVRPNDSTGWVPREALDSFHVLTTRLVVDRGSFVARLYRKGHVIFRAQIGVGRASAPTPAGNFYVREELQNFDNPLYG